MEVVSSGFQWLAGAYVVVNIGRGLVNTFLPADTGERFHNMVFRATHRDEWRSPLLAQYTQILTVENDQTFRPYGEDQERLLNAIVSDVTKGAKHCVLLHGKSGSGKSTLVKGLIGHPMLEGRKVLQLKLGELREKYHKESDRQPFSLLKLFSRPEGKKIAQDFKAIFEELLKLRHEIVLFVDEGEQLFNLMEQPSANDGEGKTLFSNFKEIMAEDGPIIIAAMTQERYEARWEVGSGRDLLYKTEKSQVKIPEDEKRRWQVYEVKEWTLKQTISALTCPACIEDYSARYGADIESKAAELFLHVYDREYKTKQTGRAVYPDQACDKWRSALTWFKSQRNWPQEDKEPAHLNNLRFGTINIDAVRWFFENQGFERDQRPMTLAADEFATIQAEFEVEKTKGEELFTHVFKRVNSGVHSSYAGSRNIDGHVEQMAHIVGQPGSIVFLRSDSFAQTQLLISETIWAKSNLEWYEVDLSVLLSLINDSNKLSQSRELQSGLYSAAAKARKEGGHVVLVVRNAGHLADLLQLQRQSTMKPLDSGVHPPDPSQAVMETIWNSGAGELVSNFAENIGFGGVVHKAEEAVRATQPKVQPEPKNTLPTNSDFVKILGLLLFGTQSQEPQLSIIAHVSSSFSAIPACAFSLEITPLSFDDQLKVAATQAREARPDLDIQEEAVLMAFHLTQTCLKSALQPDRTIRLLLETGDETARLTSTIAANREAAPGSQRKGKEKARPTVVVKAENVRDYFWRQIARSGSNSRIDAAKLEKIAESAHLWRDSLWKEVTAPKTSSSKGKSLRIEVPGARTILAKLNRASEPPILVVPENSMERRRLLAEYVASNRPIVELDLSSIACLSEKPLIELVTRQISHWPTAVGESGRAPVLCIHHHISFRDSTVRRVLNELAGSAGVPILYFCSDDMNLPVTQKTKKEEPVSTQPSSLKGTVGQVSRMLTGFDVQDAVDWAKKTFHDNKPEAAPEAANAAKNDLPLQLPVVIEYLKPLSDGEVRGFASRSAQALSSAYGVGYDPRLFENLPEALKLMPHDDAEESSLALDQVQGWVECAFDDGKNRKNKKVSASFFAGELNKDIGADSVEDILDVLTPGIARYPSRVTRHLGNYTRRLWSTGSSIVNIFVIKPMIVLLPFLLMRKIYSRITAITDRLLSAI